MAKIATVITDMFEDVEYTSPKAALEAAGHEVITIDIEAGKEVEGKHGEKVKIDKGIEEVHASEFDALFIPGGFSPDILRADDCIVAFVKTFMDDMKPTFAICHGHSY
ncbi:Glutamine amidotransferase OS=Lysinibacillus sphaericus OX=1421 GN=LS41612_01460 PE=3 SV=1 [Lysinibacillus sphaericus]